MLCVASLAVLISLNFGRYHSISDRASDPGAIRNSYSRPSIIRFSPVLLMMSVGGIRVSVPLEVRDA